MRVVACGFVLALVALAAGSGSSAAGPRACPSLAQAAALPRWPGHTVVDRHLSSIRYRGPSGIRYASSALSTCGFFLVVKESGRTFAVRVPETDKGQGWPIGSRWVSTEADYTAPDLLVALRLGGRVVYVVARESGGTVIPLSLYRVRVGRLAEVAFHSGGQTWNGLSLYGGGAASTTFRCTADGKLVELGIGPTRKAGRFDFAKIRWRLAADGFRIAALHDTVGSADTVEAAAQRAGFDNDSFAGCTVVGS